MLSVTLTPGKQMAAAERVDNTKLNLIGSPSIALTGQVSASQIEDGSVDEDKLDLEDAELPVFDILTKRPVFNPRAYEEATDAERVQAAIEAAIAEGGGTIRIDRDYTLTSLLTADANMPAGYSFLLWAYTTSRVQLAFDFVREARLINGRTTESGNPVAMLGLKGAFEDLVVDGGGFERTQQTRVNHATIGLLLMDGAAAIKRARIHGTHFRGLSNGVAGSAAGLAVKDCWFNYPVGHPNSAAGINAAGVWVWTGFGTCEHLEIAGCKLDGCEAGEVDNVATVYGAYGLCDVKALGVSICDNKAWNISGAGIYVRAWPDGSALASVDEPRENVISRNRVTFDDLTNQTTQTDRLGIYCQDASVLIEGNKVRNAYQGIWASGSSSNWNSGDDSGSRLRKAQVLGNEVELAENLKVSDTGSATTNERFGILASHFRRVAVKNNVVTFAGRTSPAVLAKYWLVNGISLAAVDDARVAENEVYGPVETNAAATDLLMLAGLQMEYCRRVNVGVNYLRNLNIGVATSNDTGGGITPSEVVIDRQEMQDVVWAYADMSRAENIGLAATSDVHKRVRGAGYRIKKQRTSFLCDTTTLGGAFAGGWVRVGSFLKGLNGKVRVWTEESGREVSAVFEVTGWNTGAAVDGHLVQTGYMANGTALVTKARFCGDTSLAAQILHLDLYVAGLAATARIYVEVESVGFNQFEGLWGAPGLVAAMGSGFTGANASGLKELEFQPGIVVADGKWNGGRFTLGTAQFHYDTVTPHIRVNYGVDPTGETIGINIT